MFVRSKNVEGWSRCQDSRESAATKRGKIDVKTVYKIGKNMGWIILKRENPSVSRQCSTAFFFLPVPEAAIQFFLYVLKVVLCRKNGKLGLKRCACTGSRGTFFPAVLTSSSANRVLQNEYVFFFMSSNLYFVETLGNCGFKCASPAREVRFFLLSWHLVQQMGILQAKHWKMGSPHCALPHCASLLESAWSPRQIYIVVAPPVMPLPPQTGAVPVYRDKTGLSRCPKTDLEGFGTLRNRPGAPR